MQTQVQVPASTTTEQTRQQQHQPEYETDSAQLLGTPQFEDGRPEVTAQLQQQSLMANSPRATQLQAMQAMMANSPRVTQLQATQAMMAASPQVQQLKATQTFIAAGALAKQNHQASVAPITQRMEDEEPLQSMAEEPVQREQTEASATNPTPQDAPPSETPKPNNTGLPDQLKAGIENLSGISMDNVKVHYNSDKPAQLQAHAYAQGSEIHVAPGQEKHLSHEAWHVVQQAQGRVKPTMQMKGDVPVNDDAGLETEADLMGATAIQAHTKNDGLVMLGVTNNIIQQKALDGNKLNVAGETHDESQPRRESEKLYAKSAGIPYWQEREFSYAVPRFFGLFKKGTLYGDPRLLRAEHLLIDAYCTLVLKGNREGYQEAYQLLNNTILEFTETKGTLEFEKFQAIGGSEIGAEVKELRENILSYTKNKEFKTSEFFPKQLDSILKKYQIGLHKLERSGDAVSRQRSEEMKKAAATAKTPGLWKVGDDHIEDILKKPEGEIAGVSLLTKKEFNDDYDKWKSSSPVAASNLTSSSASSSDKSEGDAASSSSSSKVDKEVLVTSSPSIAASASTVSSSPALQHFEQLSGTAAVNSSLSALPLGPQQERMI